MITPARRVSTTLIQPTPTPGGGGGAWGKNTPKSVAVLVSPYPGSAVGVTSGAFAAGTVEGGQGAEDERHFLR